MQLEPRPWWLFWLGKDRWLTLSPTIYHPANINPQGLPALVAHEETHLRQQSQRKAVWLLRYLLQPSFRLSQEAEAIAVEVSHYTQEQAAWVISWYAQALSSHLYLWACLKTSTAVSAINRAITSLGDSHA